MSQTTLSQAAQRLLGRLRAYPQVDTLWVSPAESVGDSWVLIAPLGEGSKRIAVQKVPETAITELVKAGHASWTAADENIPTYECGLLTREPWFRGRKGRRIGLVPSS